MKKTEKPIFKDNPSTSKKAMTSAKQASGSKTKKVNKLNKVSI